MGLNNQNKAGVEGLNNQHTAGVKGLKVLAGPYIMVAQHIQSIDYHSM